MNTITLEQLKEHHACTGQLHLFKRLFGNEVEVTVEKCAEYYNKFDWIWAAEHLLSDELHKEFLKIKQPACEEYFKIVLPAYEEYLKIKQPAWEEFQRIEQPVWREYKKKIAQTFGRCYLKQ